MHVASGTGRPSYLPSRPTFANCLLLREGRKKDGTNERASESREVRKFPGKEVKEGRPAAQFHSAT